MQQLARQSLGEGTRSPPSIRPAVSGISFADRWGSAPCSCRPVPNRTGATVFVVVASRSHRVSAFLSAILAAATGGHRLASWAFLVFDSCCIHRAAITCLVPEAGSNHVFTVPTRRPQISLPDALQGRHRRPPGSAVVGSYSRPRRSPPSGRHRGLGDSRVMTRDARAR